MSQAEGFIRRAIVDLAEQDGINLREADCIRLVAVYREGHLSFATEIDALGSNTILSSPVCHGEAILRASLAGLRATIEPSIGVDPTLRVLDEQGGHIGSATFAAEPRRGTKRL